tara:strand:- start:226 stop:663 length:438 start_codon:yes stop_codon:yes gene_type:complete
MTWYRELLALHVLAIISWMAGILYLYRLLVYAAEQGYDKEDVVSLLQTMSRRLWKGITIPAMTVSWIAGLSMVVLNPSIAAENWFIVKLISVILLTASTIYAGIMVSRYQKKLSIPTGKHFRYMNEVPTLLMIIIVVMVIIRPLF